MDKHSKILVDNPATKKKPPKLKALDRSISIAIDNYTPSAPPPQMIIDDSLLLEDSSPLPPPIITTSKPTEIYFVSGDGTSPIRSLSSSLGGNGVGAASTSAAAFSLEDYPHYLRKANFRRSDTIDVHSPSNFQMRKTLSFHNNDQSPTVEQFLLARRASSVKGSYLFPQQLNIKEPTTVVVAQSIESNSPEEPISTGITTLRPGSGGGGSIDRTPSPNRRSCRMHRSFNEQQIAKRSAKGEITVERVKFPSLNDDILQDTEAKMQSFDSSNISLNNEVLRSRSNSRSKDEAFYDPATAAIVAGLGIATGANIVSSASASAINSRRHLASSSLSSSSSIHKHSSHSLDQQQLHQQQQQQQQLQQQQQQSHNFKRGTKHTHSLYLSPNNLEELQIHQQRSLQGNKKSHSSSMRVRPYRESLSATKKSKSFMVDTYPPEFELSPHVHRRESRALITPLPGTSGVSLEESIKRSPRPSSSGTSGAGSSLTAGLKPSSSSIAAAVAAAAAASSHHLLIDDKIKRSSFERKASSSYDINGVDFDPVMLRPFRQSHRKSSLTDSMKKMKKKSLNDDPDDDDDESDRKRKRIVCIIMTVFLCLVCASVFVVIITLTHSSVSQVQNQTRKVYTFSRDSPIHYNVRQENERLMQESMRRASLLNARNFTDPASLTATAVGGEGIP